MERRKFHLLVYHGCGKPKWFFVSSLIFSLHLAHNCLFILKFIPIVFLASWEQLTMSLEVPLSIPGRDGYLFLWIIGTNVVGTARVMLSCTLYTCCININMNVIICYLLIHFFFAKSVKNSVLISYVLKVCSYRYKFHGQWGDWSII